MRSLRTKSFVALACFPEGAFDFVRFALSGSKAGYFTTRIDTIKWRFTFRGMNSSAPNASGFYDDRTCGLFYKMYL